MFCIFDLHLNIPKNIINSKDRLTELCLLEMSHNSDLYKAFIDKSLGRFVEALEVFEADLNSFPQNESRTIFEIILSTPDSASFIEKCIEFGADFYEVIIF